MTASKPASGTPQVKATYASAVRRDLLQHHYQYVATLREYLLCKLPSSSRLRRRKIALIGTKEVLTPNEKKMANFLDTTLVGCDMPSQQQDPTRWATWLSFSQRPDDSHVTVSGGLESAMFCQREVCLTKLLLNQLVLTHGSWLTLRYGSFLNERIDLATGQGSSSATVSGVVTPITVMRR